MRKLAAIVILLLPFLSSAQQFEWAVQGGSPFFDRGRKIAVDSRANIYVAGEFSGVSLFGDTTVTEYGHSDIFLAKYDSSGNFLWVQQIRGIGSDEADGLVVDSEGNCYLTGFTGWDATFGSGADTVTIQNKGHTGSFDIFIAKYNTNGKLLWVKSPGSEENDYAKGIAVDTYGNVYITGWVCDTSVFGEGSKREILNLPRGGMITAKYDSTGSLDWVRVAKADNDDPFSMGGVTGYGIGVDIQGSVYICGSAVGPNTFIDSSNPISISSPLNRDPFVAKYSPDGQLQWVNKGINGNKLFTLTGLNTDENGTSYLSGYFDGTITFDGITINSNDGHILLAKFDSSGNCMWARGEGRSLGSSNSIKPKSDGSFFVTGRFEGIAVFGTNHQVSLTSVKSPGEFFVAKYDFVGEPEWVIQPSGGNYGGDYSADIAFDKNDNCYITGSFAATTVFGQTSLTVYPEPNHNNYGDIFVAKISASSVAGQHEIKNSHSSLQIFPNPTDNVISISYKVGTEVQMLRVEIKNVMGQTVYIKSHYQFSGTLYEDISLGNQAKGIYFIEIISDKSKVVRKIILE